MSTTFPISKFFPLPAFCLLFVQTLPALCSDFAYTSPALCSHFAETIPTIPGLGPHFSTYIIPGLVLNYFMTIFFIWTSLDFFNKLQLFYFSFFNYVIFGLKLYIVPALPIIEKVSHLAIFGLFLLCFTSFTLFYSFELSFLIIHFIHIIFYRQINKTFFSSFFFIYQYFFLFFFLLLRFLLFFFYYSFLLLIYYSYFYLFFSYSFIRFIVGGPSYFFCALFGTTQFILLYNI